MRIVLCDATALLRELVESMLTRAGHEVVGIADSVVAGVRLVEASHPDLVIYDIALGFNTDFDLIQTASAVGATTIVFSLVGHEVHLSSYDPAPMIVDKPDLAALERALTRVGQPGRVTEGSAHDRRQRPVKGAAGPPPTGLADAQAFYEAINAAEEGDALVSIEVPSDGLELGEKVQKVTRGTDRLLASPSSVKAFLVGGGTESIESFLSRVGELAAVPAGAAVRSVVVDAGEEPSDAFDRLRHGTEHPVP